MKRKLERFAEMATFDHVVQPKIEEVLNKDYKLKGNWNAKFFNNNNPIVIELGCGKGEYTVGLAQKFKNKNFIGIDIKGSRMWRGAKTVLEEGINNTGFLRTRIEFINSFFNKNEITDIWLTFPDPQLKKPRKRLTSPHYLNIYNKFLKSNGAIQLKTDNEVLYKYTLDLALYNQLTIIDKTDNLYNAKGMEEAKLFKTFYELKYLSKGIKIKYLKFKLNNKIIVDLPDEE